MNELYELYGPEGLVTIIVITADGEDEPATAEYCSELRERFQLPAEVVYDPERLLEAYGKNDLVLLTDSEATIVFKRRGASIDAIKSAIEMALGDE